MAKDIGNKLHLARINEGYAWAIFSCDILLTHVAVIVYGHPHDNRAIRFYKMVAFDGGFYTEDSPHWIVPKEEAEELTGSKIEAEPGSHWWIATYWKYIGPRKDLKQRKKWKSDNPNPDTSL
jgi:hypothetical protein